MSGQVMSIQKGIRSRLWMLSHLYQNGFNEEELLKIYKFMIIPLHDYCCSVYHSSLTQQQSHALERLQIRALKNIYGYQHSYRSLLERTGLAKLSDRRESRTFAFASRCTTGRFARWFPPNPRPRDTRRAPPFREDFARCRRLQRSPIFYMRKMLNQAVSA